MGAQTLHEFGGSLRKNSALVEARLGLHLLPRLFVITNAITEIFEMAEKFTVTNKASHVSTETVAQEISLTDLSVVEVPLHRSQVKSLTRQGKDLIITTIDGQTLVVHDFFVDREDGRHNDLVLQDDNGLWLADVGSLGTSTEAGANTVDIAAGIEQGTTGTELTAIESIEPLLDPLGSPVGLLLGGLAVLGGGVALAASGGGSGSGQFVPTIEHLTPNSNGTLVVTGHGRAGDTVTVTYPDGSTVITTAGSDGSYSTTSAAPQTSGEVTATDTDPAGNVSPPADATYTDTTAPLAPGVNLTPNSDGSITVSGTAEPGSTVHITFPDGSTGSATVGPDGTYSANSGPSEGGGNVTVTDTDPAGNTSPATTVVYTPNGDGGTTPTTPGTTSNDGNGGTSDNGGNGGTTPTPGVAITSHTDDISGKSVLVTDNTIPTLDNTPLLGGTVTNWVAGDTLKVYDGSTYMGDATVDPSSGNWTLQINGLSTGPHNFTAVMTSPSGAADATSDPFALTVDRAALIPTATAVISSITEDTGSSATDFITNDPTLLVNAKLTGALDPKDQVQISLDGGKTWNAATQQPDGTYQIDNTGTTLPDGNYTFEARVVDTAGNASVPGTQPVTIDTTPPAAPAAPTSYDDNVGPDQSPTSTAQTTDDNTPGINIGSVPTGDAPTLYVDGKEVPSSYDPSTGTLTPDTPVKDGQHDFTYTLTDPAGNESPQSGSLPITIDTSGTGPTAPPTPVSYDDNVGPIRDTTSHAPTTDDPTPGVNIGKGLIDTPTLYVDGKEVPASYDPSTGTLTPNAPLPDGPHDFTYTLTDPVGNESPQSGPLQITIDTTAPSGVAQINYYTDDVGPDKDDYLSGTTTDDNAPVLKGTVSGLEAGDELKIYDTVGGVPSFVGDAVVDPSGTTWTLQVNGLNEGVHNFTAVVADAAGNTGTASPVFDLTVNTSAVTPPTPTTTAVITSITQDTGPSATDYNTSDPNPVVHVSVSGPLAASEKVQISLDNGQTWHDATGSGTAYQLDTSTVGGLLPDGQYTIEAQVVNTAGNASTPDSKDMVIDTTAPTSATLLVTVATIAGDNVVDTTEASSLTPVPVTGSVIGNGEWRAGDTVTLKVDGNIIGTGALKADGTFSINVPGSALAGATVDEVTATVTAQDTAGNTGDVTGSHVYTVDTTTPPPSGSVTTTVHIDSIVRDSGSNTTDFITNDNDGLTINATLSAALKTGETLRYSDDNGAHWQDVTSDVSGTAVTFDDPNLTSTNTIVLQVINAAANQGGQQATQLVTIDTTAPDAPVITDTTRDPGTGDVTVSGTAEPGSTVTVTFPDGTTGTATPDPNTGDYRVTSTAPQPENGDVSATATDPAGNTSPEGDGHYPPTSASVQAPTIDLPIIPITNGTDATQGTITVTGTATPGDTVTVTFPDHTTATVPVDPTGHYTATSQTSQPSGPVTAIATDPASHVSDPASQPYVDQVAPFATAAISAIADDTGGGTSSTGFITSDQTLVVSATVTGTVQASDGEKVQISLDNGSTWHDAIAQGGGVYAYDATGTTLPEGSYTFQARVIDAAGNASAPGSSPVTIDTSAPDSAHGNNNAIAITDYADNVGLVQSDHSTAPTTDDTTPELHGTVSGLASTDVIYVYDDGTTNLGTATIDTSGATWSLQLGTQSDGLHNYTAVITDTAGNGGTTSSPPFALTIDTSVLSGGATAPTTTVDISGITVDTGIPGDFITSDNDGLLVSATLSAALTGETLQYSTDNGAHWLDISSSVSGTDVSYQDDNLTSTATIEMRVVNSDGNAGPTASQLVTIDTTAPTSNNSVAITSYTDDVLPQTGDFQSGTSTNDTQPALHGTVTGLATGDTVQIYAADGSGSPVGSSLGQATVTNGNWTYQFITDLSEGQHDYVAVIEDVAGNQGTTSAPFDLTVDTTPPTTGPNSAANAVTISGYHDNVGTGAGIGDFTVSPSTTDDNTPLLQGTVTGLNPGDVVEIYQDGTLLANAVVGTLDSNGNGDWTYQLGIVPDGTHTYTAKIADAAGNVGTASNDFTLTVDTHTVTPPNPTATATISSITEDTGTPGDFTTSDTTLLVNATVTGTLATGEKVQISTDQGQTWHDATSQADGSYQYDMTSTALSAGTYTFEARVVNTAGNASAATQQTVVIDTTAPTSGNSVTIDSYDDATLPVTGNFASGSTTDETTPLLHGKVSGLATGDVVQIYADDANGTPTTLLGTATLAGDGTWTYKVPTADALSDGPHGFTAQIADIAGNLGTRSAEFNLTVDTSAPPTLGNTLSIDSYTDDILPQTGTSFSSSTPTNDPNPTLNGSVSMIGGLGNNSVQVYENVNGNLTLLGKAVIDSSNASAWSFDLPTLEDKTTHTYVAMIVNPAGNTGTVSNTFAITEERSAPTTGPDGNPNGVAITAYTDDVAPQTGTFTDFTVPTNDTTPALSGTVTNIAPTDGVQIYEGTTLLGTATVTGNSWNYQVTGALTEGPHTFTAKVVDAAGNVGTASTSETLTVDTQPPSTGPGSTPATVSINTYTDNVDPLTGDFNSGTQTNDTSPLLNGTVNGFATGDVVLIYEGTQLLGTATVDPATATSTMGTGGWTYQLTGLSEGTHDYTAVVASAAGVAGPDSGPFSLTVNTTPPTSGNFVSITNYADNVDPQTGNFDSSVPTNDPNPVLNGHVSRVGGMTGYNVEILQVDGSALTTLGTATVNADGSWTYQVSALDDGKTYTYIAAITDGAGNIGTQSSPFSITENQKAPSSSDVLTIDSYTDDVGTLTGTFSFANHPTDDKAPVLNGTVTGLEPGDVVQIYQDGNATPLGTATVAGNSWSYQVPNGALTTDRDYTFTAKIVDAAGNVGTTSNATLTVDTTPPTETAHVTGIFPDSGNSNDFTTTANQLQVTATVDGTTPLADGEQVQISLDNGSTWNLATQTSDPMTYQYDMSTAKGATALADGTYIFEARVVDAAGNVGAILASQPVKIVPSPSNLIVNTTSNGDGTATVNGHTDIAQAGDVVTVYFPDNTTASGTVDGNGQYSVSSTTVQPDGSTVISVVTDPFGNTATATDQVVDRTPPTAPKIDSVLTDSGNETVTVTNVETGSTVTLAYPDGSTVIVGPDGNDPQGHQIAAVTPDSTNPSISTYVIGTPYTGPDGNLIATATDAAGNHSTPSNPFLLESLSVGFSPDTGGPDGITSLVAPANPDHSVTVSINTSSGDAVPAGDTLQYQVLDASGNTVTGWHDTTLGTSVTIFDSTSVPPDGQYTVQAQIVDSTTGQVVNGTYSTSFILDDTPPNAPMFSSDYIGARFNMTDIQLAGLSVDTVSVQAYFHGVGGNLIGSPQLIPVVNPASPSEVSGFSVNPGDYAELQAMDIAGNVSGSTYIPLGRGDGGAVIGLDFSGGKDTIAMDKFTTADPLGNNGLVNVDKFTVGNYDNDPSKEADRIDLSQLLSGTPAATVEANLDNYVQVRNYDGQNADLYVDINGGGISAQQLLIHLTNIAGGGSPLTAADLINNHQLIV
jgi:hypothetical protein